MDGVGVIHTGEFLCGRVLHWMIFDDDDDGMGNDFMNL